MDIMQGAFGQFRKPTGWLARLAGIGMNIGHEKVWRWGLEHVVVVPDAVILDVGCGGGRAVKILAQAAPNGKVAGIDHSEDVLPLARRVNRRLIEADRVEIRHASVSSLPFTDDVFDLVTAFETYIFWPSPVDALREVRRVLKPGGTLLIANEAYPDERFADRNTKWGRLAGIEHLDGPEEYRAHLTEAGYVHVQVETAPEKNWIAAIARAPGPSEG